MSTKLEKYLKENRPVFDVEYPDDNAIWERIKESGMPQEKKDSRHTRRIITNFRRIAASAIIILALSYVAIDLAVGISFNNKNNLAQINEEYGNIEEDYLQTVRYKQKEINKTDIPDSEIIKTILDELKQLDELYRESSKDLAKIDDNQRVVNTIFNIYERKIELLERIIVETNKYDNYEKNNESEI